MPTPTCWPAGIAAGPDGALWFTEQIGQKIGRITTSGTITEYPISNPSAPYGITAGPDGALWFAEQVFNRIGRITTAGAVTEYPVPTPNAIPYWITPGPDGALWFTEQRAGKIGRITTAGVVTEYPLAPNAFPNGITAGPDGALWFAEYVGNRIGRITTAGMITEYPVPGSGGPWGITRGPDGALWYVEWAGGIGRITTAGVITEYTIPGSGQHSTWITAGPDGELWFSNPTYNRIGEAVFVTASLTVSPADASYQTNLTFTGSGFAPDERVNIYASGVGSAVLAGATADSSGSFTATASEPQSPYGPRLFLGTGQSSGKLGATSFFVTARLILSPNSGPVGSTVTAQGYGFGGGNLVRIYWNNPRTLLGTATANVYGMFTGKAALTFTVPTGAPAGGNVVDGVGNQANALGAFTVE